MQRYNELLRVAEKYYRARCGEGGWCTVIALAVATDLPFGKARSLLFKHAKRVNGRGTYPSLVHKTLELLGYKAEPIVDYKSKTLITIQRELAGTTGTYFVYTDRHVTAIRDGVCEDWANNEHGRPTKYKIWSIYKITKQGA